jgi:hypothetical protein
LFPCPRFCAASSISTFLFRNVWLKTGQCLSSYIFLPLCPSLYRR